MSVKVATTNGLTPFQEWFFDSRYENCWTPDVPLLETQDFWYVFVATDKRGKHSSYFTNPDSDATFAGWGYTTNPMYGILNVRMKDTHKTLHLLDIGVQGKHVVGDVFCVDTEFLIDMDADERNLLQTRRIMTKVTMMATPKAEPISCWTYIGEPKFLNTPGLEITKFTHATNYHGKLMVDY